MTSLARACLLIVSSLLLPVLSAMAAPTLAPGQLTRFDDPASLEKAGYDLAFLLKAYTQDSDTTFQTKRFAWKDSNEQNPEERHRERHWQTEFELQGLEACAGLVIPDACTLYGLVGVVNADLAFAYYDETNYEKDDNDNKIPYERTTRFEDPGRVYFGAGITASMARWMIDDARSVVLDLDTRYRYFNYKPETDAAGRKYEATVHDVQLTVGASLLMPTVSPFAGFRITYLAGEETFQDPNRSTLLSVSESIEPGDDIGYFFGVRLTRWEALDLSLTLRTGDDEGWEIGAAARF